MVSFPPGCRWPALRCQPPTPLGSRRLTALVHYVNLSFFSLGHLETVGRGIEVTSQRQGGILAGDLGIAELVPCLQAIGRDVKTPARFVGHPLPNQHRAERTLV